MAAQLIAATHTLLNAAQHDAHKKKSHASMHFHLHSALSSLHMHPCALVLLELSCPLQFPLPTRACVQTFQFHAFIPIDRVVTDGVVCFTVV